MSRVQIRCQKESHRRLVFEGLFSPERFVCTLDAHDVICVIGPTLSYLP